MSNYIPKRRNRWFAFYSQAAVDRGCSVATYRNRYGDEIVVTGVSPTRDGMGYYWKDKVFLGDLNGYRCVKNTYVPHPDLYKY
jgi:hypothetical protein